MTKAYTQQEKGTGGTPADTIKLDYPGVPYTQEDFNQPSCPIVGNIPENVSADYLVVVMTLKLAVQPDEPSFRCYKRQSTSVTKK